MKNRLIGSLLGLMLVVAAAGCATKGDIAKAVGRVDRNVEALSGRLNSVQELAKETAGAVAAVDTRVKAVETGKATTVYVDAETKKLTEAMKAVSTKAGADTKAAVEGEQRAREAAVKAVQEKVTAQQKYGQQLTRLFNMAKHNDADDKGEILAGLGSNKIPTAAITCSGFESGESDFAKVLKANAACVKDVVELEKAVKAGGAKVLAAIGYEDTVSCKKPVTPECSNVARLRAEGALKHLGADVKLAIVRAPTDAYGKTDDNRRVRIFWQKVIKP